MAHFASRCWCSGEDRDNFIGNSGNKNNQRLSKMVQLHLKFDHVEQPDRSLVSFHWFRLAELFGTTQFGEAKVNGTRSRLEKKAPSKKQTKKAVKKQKRAKISWRETQKEFRAILRKRRLGVDTVRRNTFDSWECVRKI